MTCPQVRVGPRLQGDEAVSEFETVEVINEALKYLKAQIISDLSEYTKKDYVDAQDDLRVLKADDTMVKRKPLITVWAENKRSMVDNRYEWSFGSDAARGYSNGGYPMLAAGRVLRMGLSTTASHSGVSDAGVNISVNGKEKSHMARPNCQVKSLVFLYLKPLRTGPRRYNQLQISHAQPQNSGRDGIPSN